MSSIESLKEKARRHEQREEWQRALDLYSQAVDRLAREDQPDIGLYNRLGDIQTRIGNLEDAAKAYDQAIDLYVESELPNNAIAVCKKVIRNMPYRNDVYLRIGQIRALQGFLVDARSSFLTYAERMQDAGEIDEALRALVEFADLAPEDLEIRLAVAEQLQGRERTDEALEQLAEGYRVAVKLEQDEMIRSFKAQLTELDPELDPEALLDVGDVWEAGDAESAAMGFEADQVALEGGSGGADELDTGLDEFAFPEEEEGIPEAGTELDEAGETELEPADSDAATDVEPGGMEPLPGLEHTSLDGAPEPEPLPGLEPTSMGGETEPEDSLPELPGLEDTEAPIPSANEMEDDAFALPGLEDEDTADEGVAEEDLEAETVEAGAVEDEEDLDLPDEDFQLDGTFGGDEDLPALEGAASPERAGYEGEADRAADGEDPEGPVGAEAVADAMEEAASEVREADRVEPEELEQEGERLEIAGDRDRAVQRLDQAREGFDAAGDLPAALRVARRLLELQPDGVDHHQRMVELAFRSNDDSTLTEAYLGLADALEQKGEEDRARGVYQQVLSLDPGNEAALAGIRGEGATATSVQEVASSEDYVDLGGLILDDEEEEKTTRFKVAYEEPTGDEQADFRRMLSQFKRKVAENVDTGDVKAHHDLGTAYKEMGLLDEAIEEFQAALRARGHHLPTYELLGQCFLEKGQVAAAVRSLTRALDAQYQVEDELIGIYYYLGRAHQKMGNTDSAVEFYDRVFSLDINFADVTERLRDLR